MLGLGLNPKHMTYKEAFDLYNNCARALNAPRKTIGEWISVNELGSIVLRAIYGIKDPEEKYCWEPEGNIYGWAPLETQEDSD